MILKEKQITNAILMVRPVAFGFNKETSLDNAFQNESSEDLNSIQQLALLEFDNMVELLRENGIMVKVIEDTLTPKTPDSIFPNNWFSTHSDGRVALYPLKAENRREERRSDVFEYLVEVGFTVKHIEDFSDAEQEGKYLESTGSLILDRENELCYVSVSERSNPELVVEFCEVFGYQPVFFQSIIKGNSVYHTNVCMSIATSYALVALDSFSREDEKSKTRNALVRAGKEVIELSEEQILNFAGNGLEVQDENGKSCFVLSKRAYDSLDQNQIEIIKKYSKVITPEITTIENIGGGSARCMMAEIFLPYRRK
jgi:hypothetical protein